jgi:hypothetical protein
MFKQIVVAAAFLALAPAAHAERIAFSATLNGNQAPTITGSVATGNARVTVDTASQTVDIAMDVAGLTIDSLFDHVIHSGVGPVHLHLYAANGDISLLLPFPYGAAYAETPGGFRLEATDVAYAENAARVGSTLTFEQFVATLGSDFVYLNIHTDAVPDGEISGRLVPAS